MEGSDYYSDLDKIRAAGREYGASAIAAGDTEPQEGLFSGEWADGLAWQDALDLAGLGGVVRFDDLGDFEQIDVLDAFEDGYYSAFAGDEA